MEKLFYRLIGHFPPGIAYHFDLMWSLKPLDYWMTIFRCILNWWRVKFFEHCLCIAYRVGLTKEMPFSMEIEEYEKIRDGICTAMLEEAILRNVTTIRLTHSLSKSVVTVEYLISGKYQCYRALQQSGELFEFGGDDMIAWMKLQANLDIAEKHKAQSGRFLYAPLNIHLLVETVPTDRRSCEDAIIRIDYGPNPATTPESQQG